MEGQIRNCRSHVISTCNRGTPWGSAINRVNNGRREVTRSAGSVTRDSHSRSCTLPPWLEIAQRPPPNPNLNQLNLAQSAPPSSENPACMFDPLSDERFLTFLLQAGRCFRGHSRHSCRTEMGKSVGVTMRSMALQCLKRFFVQESDVCGLYTSTSHCRYLWAEGSRRIQCSPCWRIRR